MELIVHVIKQMGTIFTNAFWYTFVLRVTAVLDVVTCPADRYTRAVITLERIILTRWLFKFFYN